MWLLLLISCSHCIQYQLENKQHIIVLFRKIAPLVFLVTLEKSTSLMIL